MEPRPLEAEPEALGPSRALHITNIIQRTLRAVRRSLDNGQVETRITVRLRRGISVTNYNALIADDDGQ